MGGVVFINFFAGRKMHREEIVSAAGLPSLVLLQKIFSLAKVASYPSHSP
tara:strand:+ start:1799 stop:1948 length:150 start_codon:yes stop_codon:yes gene_type:complete